MNILIIGPQLEERALPRYCLNSVPENNQNALEVLTRRIATEIHQKQLTIIGLPWVNPKGRAKTIVSVGDYLADPVYLLRVLEVGFLAQRSGYPANAAIIACDLALNEQLQQAKNWVLPRLATSISRDHLIWHAFSPDFNGVFEIQGNTQPNNVLANKLPLPGLNITLTTFLSAVEPLFK